MEVIFKNQTLKLNRPRQNYLEAKLWGWVAKVTIGFVAHDKFNL